jgi:hypothetical protein
MKLILKKMGTKLIDGKAHYDLGDVAISEYLGKKIVLKHTGKIFCQGCNTEIKKSYAQGYCYPCMVKLPECDICIVRPEKCHYFKGTCRDSRWGLKNCFQPHYVYLALSSNLKVGITRESNIPHRWIDQGAISALPIMKVPHRLASGMIESFLSEYLSDKTNWRDMLKGKYTEVDLTQSREEIYNEFGEVLEDIESEIDELEIGGAVEFLEQREPTFIQYPVVEYPIKVNSLNFDKSSLIEGELKGIKGQYLILDSGVLNIRKFTGYEVEIEL